MKKKKTTLQIIADWLAIDSSKNDRDTIFRVRHTKEMLLLERIKQSKK